MGEDNGACPVWHADSVREKTPLPRRGRGLFNHQGLCPTNSSTVAGSGMASLGVIPLR
jgi:hypothetical protein